VIARECAMPLGRRLALVANCSVAKTRSSAKTRARRLRSWWA